MKRPTQIPTGTSRGGLYLIFAIALLVPVCRSAAASPAEIKAYDVALRSFQTGAFELAEKELAEFLTNHPASEKLPEAILLQAQCRYQQKHYQPALSLLRENLGRAGGLADQYRYWIGELWFQLENYTEAATAFSEVLSAFANSSLRLDASVGEAFAVFRQGELSRALELLSRPEGAFQKSAQSHPDSELTARGYLLLGEVCLGLKEFQAGEDALGRLTGRKLPPELLWRQQYLLARLQFAGQRFDASLQTLTNLLGNLDSVTNASALRLHSDAIALQGELFQTTGNVEASIQAYEKNLASPVPVDRRQQALQEIVLLLLQQNKFGEAGRRLEAFVSQTPNDPALDFLRLTLGELRLKEYYALPEASRRADTNLLQQARLQFDRVVGSTNLEFAAVAGLNRGWCLWEEGENSGATNKTSDALLAFETAALSLPRSQRQAVARFKLADCQFRLANFRAAASNYWAVATNYSDAPPVAAELAQHALYQIVRAGIQSGDLATAEPAVGRLLTDYPDNLFSGRSALLYGQALNRLGQPSEARKFFTEFKEAFRQSPFVPDVELALARTFEQEGKWREAADEYDRWVTNHVDHPSLPRAGFDRAWAYSQSGNETGAFNLFTNYLVQFPGSTQAPVAQIWIAGYFFGQEKYDLAELNFRKVYQNTTWSPSELTFQARMMAGRAAFFRQGYPEAIGYFTNLINDPICPAALLPEAYYALADTYVRYAEAVGSSTNALGNYNEAIAALSGIRQTYPNSPLASLAWGRIGDCYLQLAANDPKNYVLAGGAYTNVIKSADVKARSLAEVGLALVLEKQAKVPEKQTQQPSAAEQARLLTEALAHLLAVVDGKNLRDTEQADPFWVKKAAVEAARLAEEQQRWNIAANLYQRLRDELAPALRKTWELRLERMEQIRSQSERGNN